MTLNKKKIFIIAGEASGDFLGANLVTNVMSKVNNQVEFFGICGDKMLESGVKQLFDTKEIALMGFIEILPSLIRIMKLIDLTVKSIMNYEPDLIITIDSPGFNFRVVKKIRKLMNEGKLKKIKIIHYVAPTVWAYNAKRVKTVKALYDHIMLLFPFEAKYFVNMPHTVIGHPAVEKCITRKKASNNEEEQIIIVMPGSRKGEIARHMDVLGQAMLLICKNRKKEGQGIKFFIPTTRNVENYLNNFIIKKKLREELSQYCAQIIVTSDEKTKSDYVNLGDMGIIKSGTSTLEIALLNIPMICFYKISPFTAFVLKRKLSINRFALPNIILNRNIVPELIQESFTANNIALYEQNLSQSKNKQLQLNEFKKLRNMIGGNSKNTPSTKAASVVLHALKL